MRKRDIPGPEEQTVSFHIRVDRVLRVRLRRKDIDLVTSVEETCNLIEDKRLRQCREPIDDEGDPQ